MHHPMAWEVFSRDTRMNGSLWLMHLDHSPPQNNDTHNDTLKWACERFRDSLIGKHFCLDTDHKPLLSLLGAQALDLLPLRIQRFRMRLMHYSYFIVYAPGKSLWTADTLSCSPVKASMPAEEKELMESTNIYVDCVIESLPVSPSYIGNLKEQLKADNVCSCVMILCTEGWLAHAKQEPLLKNY